MTNIFDRLPPIPVEIELTTMEQDYLAKRAATHTGPWTHSMPPEVSIVLKLNAAAVNYHRREVGLDARS
jgi:hypothetical protein